MNSLTRGSLLGYDKYLITGATGIAPGQVDTRIKNATFLREGVFQISGSKMPYDAYTASPVHRFFQMWQQTDCNADYATLDNASGCLNDLFPWLRPVLELAATETRSQQSSTTRRLVKASRPWVLQYGKRVCPLF